MSTIASDSRERDAADIWDDHEELLEEMLESDDPVERGWAEAMKAAAEEAR